MEVEAVVVEVIITRVLKIPTINMTLPLHISKQEVEEVEELSMVRNKTLNTLKKEKPIDSSLTVNTIAQINLELIQKKCGVKKWIIVELKSLILKI